MPDTIGGRDDAVRKTTVAPPHHSFDSHITIQFAGLAHAGLEASVQPGKKIFVGCRGVTAAGHHPAVAVRDSW